MIKHSKQFIEKSNSPKTIEDVVFNTKTGQIVTKQLFIDICKRILKLEKEIKI